MSNRPSTTGLEDDLSVLVDKHTLAEVLNCLEGVCVLRSEHYRHNEHNEPAAQAWEEVSRPLNLAWNRAQQAKL